MPQSVDNEFAAHTPPDGAAADSAQGIPFGPPIVCQGELTLQHEERAFRLTSRSIWIFRIMGLAAGGFAAIYFWKWWVDKDPKVGPGLVVGQLLGATALFHFDRVLFWIVSRTARLAGYPASKHVTFRIDESGVLAQTAPGVSHHAWKQFDHLTARHDLIVLQSHASDDPTCIIIPREFAQSASDWSRLTSYVLTRKSASQRRSHHGAPPAAARDRAAQAPQPPAADEGLPVVLDGEFGWRQQVLALQFLQPPLRYVVAIYLLFAGPVAAIGLLMNLRDPAVMLPAVLTLAGGLMALLVFNRFLPQILRLKTWLSFRFGFSRPERITWTFTADGMRKVTRMGDLALQWSDLRLAGRTAQMIVLYSPSRLAFECLPREFATAADWERLASLVAERAKSR